MNEARREFYENIYHNDFMACVFAPRKQSEVYPCFSTQLANYHVHERGSYIFPRETRGVDLLSDRDANIAEKSWRILRKHFGLIGERRDADARAFVGKLFRVGFASTRPHTKPNTERAFPPIGRIFPFRKIGSKPYLNRFSPKANR